MGAEQNPKTEELEALRERKPRELSLLENERLISGQGSYEKVTVTHAGRAILDGVAGLPSASNHGVVDIGGYVYEGVSHNNGHLFIKGNAELLIASFGGSIFVKKDPIMEGEEEKGTQKSGNVRILRVFDGGSAVIEGNADEVTASREGHAIVHGDVKVARVEDGGDIYVHGKVERKHFTPGRGQIRTANITEH